MLLGGIGGDPIGQAIDFSSLREAYRIYYLGRALKKRKK